jgi:hypothetical protein
MGDVADYYHEQEIITMNKTYFDKQLEQKSKGGATMNITDFLTKPAEAVEGFHGILYGYPKTGKTSTLDDPRFKVLLIDMEGGSAVLSEAENVTRIDIRHMAAQLGITEYEAFLRVMKAVESGELTGYDLYASDSITQFEDFVKEYVAKKYAPNRKREIEGKFGAMADWGDLKDLLTKTVKWIHGLTKRGEKSIHFLWIAHVAETKDSITNQTVATKIQLQGSNTADIVMSVVDGIFYMYNTSKPSEDGKSVEIERGVITKTMGAYVAGVRQSKKRDPLPARIPNPVWSEIFEQLGYVRK